MLLGSLMNKRDALVSKIAQKKLHRYRLKEFREAFQLTQEDVAQHLQCKQSLIAKYEANKAEITTTKLIKLSELFHCSLDTLIEKLPEGRD